MSDEETAVNQIARRSLALIRYFEALNLAAGFGASAAEQAVRMERWKGNPHGDINAGIVRQQAIIFRAVAASVRDTADLMEQAARETRTAAEVWEGLALRFEADLAAGRVEPRTEPP